MTYDHKKLKAEIDTYADTVLATIAFAHECRWNSASKKLDPSVPFGMGRPMIRQTDKVEVTPDLVVQRNPKAGTVAEVKNTFPSDTTRREQIFEQLKKYDVDLAGWWTTSKLVDDHDLVLLTHTSHATDAVDFLTHDLKGKDIGTFAKKLSIVAFARVHQSEVYFNLEKKHGDLLDVAFGEKLRKTIPIPMGHLISNQTLFNDSCPPTAYIMQILWEKVFSSLASTVVRDKDKGYKPLTVTVDELTRTVQKFYGQEADGTGNRGVPKKDWVRDAMDMFVAFRMAKREETPGTFTIRYRAMNGDILERLGRLCFEHAEKIKTKVKSKAAKTVQKAFDFDAEASS